MRNERQGGSTRKLPDEMLTSQCYTAPVAKTYKLEVVKMSTANAQTIGVDGTEYRYSLTHMDEASLYMRVVGPGLRPWLEFGLPPGLGEDEIETTLRMRIQVALSYGCGM